MQAQHPACLCPHESLSGDCEKDFTGSAKLDANGTSHCMTPTLTLDSRAANQTGVFTQDARPPPSPCRQLVLMTSS
jgi:hypothetical protein